MRFSDSGATLPIIIPMNRRRLFALISTAAAVPFIPFMRKRPDARMLREVGAVSDKLQDVAQDRDRLFLQNEQLHDDVGRRGDGMGRANQKVADLKERIAKLREITDVAKSPGNADWDPYLHGMANGLILAVHIMESRDMKNPSNVQDPGFVDAPKIWGHEKPHEPMGEYNGSLHTIRASAP